MNDQVVTVNLVPGLSAPAVVRVSQYDVGRPLTIRVLDGTGAAGKGLVMVFIRHQQGQQAQSVNRLLI